MSERLSSESSLLAPRTERVNGLVRNSWLDSASVSNGGRVSFNVDPFFIFTIEEEGIISFVSYILNSSEDDETSTVNKSSVTISWLKGY